MYATIILPPTALSGSGENTIVPPESARPWKVTIPDTFAGWAEPVFPQPRKANAPQNATQIAAISKGRRGGAVIILNWSESGCFARIANFPQPLYSAESAMCLQGISFGLTGREVYGRSPLPRNEVRTGCRTVAAAQFPSRNTGTRRGLEKGRTPASETKNTPRRGANVKRIYLFLVALVGLSSAVFFAARLNAQGPSAPAAGAPAAPARADPPRVAVFNVALLMKKFDKWQYYAITM